MDRPKIFEGGELRRIFADIERFALTPRHTGTQAGECGEPQWDNFAWDHPNIPDLKSCYDRRTTTEMFYSWAYRP